ncbi:TonB-dependent receptor [Danxiaibacter flavus]|uniref:TonB-dependent receptor n=1 Tax=Danxiaibacter flavus TaxID=3049108 RepID=A0ABV3ZHT2_9BACT|nr:TonB-dependent receptor [Chitinophagaceae bacterium DXS]
MKPNQQWRRLPFIIWCILLSCCVLMSPFTGSAQQSNTHKLTGKVVSKATGEPIVGANVSVKGSTHTAVTDAKGEFSIDAKKEDVLEVSFLGFGVRRMPVGSSTSIMIDLAEDYGKLSEVVVVGYGKMKKTDLSSAQVSVSAADINKTVNTTLEQAIQGRAAGVYVTQNSGQPGGGLSVNIRGISTLNGGTQPLYVIDGVQVQQSEDVGYGSSSSANQNPLIAGLNPSDIESIDILQGPSATAIYGSRATNGVVLITTKRGKAGQLKVGYNYMYSHQDKPNKLDIMDLPQYATMENEIRRLQTGGTGRPEFADSSILGPGTDWQNALYKGAPMQKHQLNLSGGSNNTTFYLSGEYFTQEGVAIGSKFDRGSVRLNLDNQARKWLKLSANLAFNQTNEKLGTTSESVIRNAIQMPPNIAVKNADGSWAGADNTNSPGSSQLQFTPVNPVAIASLVQNNLKRYNGLGGISAEINILKGLTFRTSLNANASWSNGSYFMPSYKIGVVATNVAKLDLSNSTSTYWNLNQMLQYNTKIGKHDISAMASHEAQKSQYSGISGSRQGFVSNDVVSLPLGNAQGQTNSSYKGTWAMESYFARVNYTYDDKYIIQGAIRADGSINFAPDNRWGYFPSASAAWRVSEESFMRQLTWLNEFKIRVETGLTGNQGSGQGYLAPLSAVTTPFGTGFMVSKFANPNVKWESTQTNNIGFNLSMLKNRIQLEGDYYIRKTSNLLMGLPEPAYMGTSGQGSIGAPTVNIGALENRGWAFTLNTVNITAKSGFTWRSNLNISAFKTKITKFYQPTAVIDRQVWSISNGDGIGFIERSAVGQAPWLFYGYVQEGIFKDKKEIEASAVPVKSDGVTRLDADPGGVWVGDIKYKDMNKDGIIDYRDQTIIGNPWPKFTYGFTNTFSYKGFDLSVLIIGSQGNDIYNQLRYDNTNPNNINLGRNLLAETFNYARLAGDPLNPTLANPGTVIPRISNGDPNGNYKRYASNFVEDGSYLRLKNITLSYNVPKSILNKLKVIQGIRLAAGVQNLATITKYKGYDPEIGAFTGRDVSSSNQVYGIDAGRYPLTRVYTLNIGVDF